MYCSTPIPDWQAYRRKYTPEYWANQRAASTDKTLHINTRWVVLYDKAVEKIDIARVRDCHRMLNLIYSGQNVEELQKVPNTEKAPFKAVIGNPRIQFLPLDSSILPVEYIKSVGPLDRADPVQDAAKRGGRVEGTLNIYIGNSGGGLVLGQADIGGNIVYGLYTTIGGYLVPGTLAGYTQGKTIAHEVGHALGLHHIFQDNLCDNFSVYTDVPEQIKPNFNTELVETSPGVWDIRGDNRSKDREFHTNFSCLHIQTEAESAPNEMGINIMDYDRDEVSIMFTQNQAETMRARLLDADNHSLILRDPGDISSLSNPTTTTLDLTIVLLLAILIPVFVLLLVLGLIWNRRRKKNQGVKEIKR